MLVDVLVDVDVIVATSVAVLVGELVDVEVNVAVGVDVGMTTTMLGVLGTALVVAPPVCPEVLVGRMLTAYSPGLSSATSPTQTPSLPTVTVCTVWLSITISNTLSGAPVPVSPT